MFVETSAKEIINHTVQDIRTVFIKKKRKESHKDCIQKTCIRQTPIWIICQLDVQDISLLFDGKNTIHLPHYK